MTAVEPEAPYEATEAERILAPGRPVPLMDGTEATLRFDMLGLYRLEEEFGTLVQVQQQLKLRVADSKLIEPIAIMLRCGVDEWSELSIPDVLRLLDVHQLSKYWITLSEAMAQSFPNPEAPGSTTAPEGNRQARRKASPGRAGTTPSQSSSTARKKPSGVPRPLSSTT